MALVAKPSLTAIDTQFASSDSPAPAEFGDAGYAREVLLLEEGSTEDVLDEALERDAKKLDITIPSPTTPSKTAHDSRCESAITVTSHHARTASSSSQRSNSTGLTSRSSWDLSTPTQARKSTPRRSLSFSRYEKYVSQTAKQNTTTLRFSPPPIPPEPALSFFSVSTRRSYASIRDGIKTRFRLKRSKSSIENVSSCTSCREDFRQPKSLHTLPCQHNHCGKCLRNLISQACVDEANMPPRCCSQAIPASTIKSVQSREGQLKFIQSVLLFSTPREERVFCPDPACGEFVPRRERMNPKHPFEVACRKCRTRACSVCKSYAHPFGVECPANRNPSVVLPRGERSCWKRCYGCRNLVELMDECSRVTCQCRSEFCYRCGAVWDSAVGCPNYCRSEAELERRRVEEDKRNKEFEAQKLAREEAEKREAAEEAAAERRTLESEELVALQTRQLNEQDRFREFEKKMRWLMWNRYGQARLEALGRHGDIQTKMKERHTRTAMHLEDRQVGAEMELRDSQKQSERSMQIRIRHMEAYCHGLGRGASGANPARVVTERDLRELGQQYNVKDDLERLHQSKINVMRDKQAKQMEQLLTRQEKEQGTLQAKHAEELKQLELTYAADEGRISRIFSRRMERLDRRWKLAQEIERKNLEMRTSLRYAPMLPISWPPRESEKVLLGSLSTLVE